jgi:hypothetical protein
VAVTSQENCTPMKDVAGKLFEGAIEDGFVIETCNGVKATGNRFLQRTKLAFKAVRSR